MRSDFFRDKQFFATLISLAIPIALQQLIIASLNAVSVMMIGQLGETTVAAVGLANQVFFLLIIMLFGISSGSAIFTAQFWGKRDVQNVRKVLGITIAMGLVGSTFFALIAILAPEFALGIYSADPAVIALGSEYLRVIGISYIATAITVSYASVLRSTGNVRLPVAASVIALSLDALLNYTLIFGLFGFPVMGVRGAALGTCIARFVECGLLLIVTYASDSAAAAHWREMLAFDREFFRRFIKTTLPVVVNEVGWSVGVSTYNMVYARIGTESIAAVNIAATIESLAFVVFIGLANACAIMIGNRIGADEEHKAFDYARRFLILVVAFGVILGVAILVGADVILVFYKVSETAHQFARNILTVMAFALWLKASNLMMFVGILRAGGDTRFGFILDVGAVWCVGIPMALLGGFVLHLPVYWVVLMTLSEEATKAVLALKRVVSLKWINNLARQIAPVEA